MDGGAPPEFAPGQAVEALYEGEWLPARIGSIAPRNSAVTLTYDEDSYEEVIPSHDVSERVRLPEASALFCAVC